VNLLAQRKPRIVIQTSPSSNEPASWPRCLPSILVCGPASWRSVFLLPREQRSAADAKRVAARLARVVIAWSGAPRPTSLRHDAAEAILVGLWGVLSAGWLRRLPPELLRSMPPMATRA
jgi:hypothetical protein